MQKLQNMKPCICLTYCAIHQDYSSSLVAFCAEVSLCLRFKTQWL